MEPPKFFVVDDFYSKPDDILNFATSLSYDTTVLSATESFVSRQRSANAKEVLEAIGEIVGVKPNWQRMNRIHEFWGFSGCGEFQLRTKAHSHEGRKHYHANGEWTGLVYLSKHIPSGEFGTRFYKHKPSETSHLIDLDAESYSWIKQDSSNQELWEKYDSPEMKFNRLVVFDCRYFHAEPPGFGQDVETGRLVQIFNFTSVGFKPSNRIQ